MHCAGCNEYIPEGISLDVCPVCGVELKTSSSAEAQEIARLRAQLASKSNDELQRLVYIENSDYKPEAVSIATQELQRRNVPKLSDIEIDTLCTRLGIKRLALEPASSQATSTLSMKWFQFYTYFRLPIGALVSFLEILVMEEYVFGLITLFDFILMTAVFWGLHKRRLWGWRLNFGFLILHALFFPLQSTSGIPYIFQLGAIIAVWVVPNIIYFEKRRHLFTRTSDKPGRHDFLQKAAVNNY